MERKWQTYAVDLPSHQTLAAELHCWGSRWSVWTGELPSNPHSAPEHCSSTVFLNIAIFYKNCTHKTSNEWVVYSWLASRRQFKCHAQLGSAPTCSAYATAVSSGRSAKHIQRKLDFLVYFWLYVYSTHTSSTNWYKRRQRRHTQTLRLCSQDEGIHLRSFCVQVLLDSDNWLGSGHRDSWRYYYTRNMCINHSSGAF